MPKRATLRVMDETAPQVATPLAPYVAAEVRAAMARRNITSAALALRVGRPKQTVHRWTAGQTPIALDDIPVICEAIGTSMTELLDAAVALRERDGATPALETSDTRRAA